MGVGRAGEVWVAVWWSVGCYSGVECRQQWGSLSATAQGSLSGELPAETSGAPEDTLLPHSVRKKLTNKQTKEGGVGELSVQFLG